MNPVSADQLIKLAKSNTDPSLLAIDALRAIEWHGVNTHECSVCGGKSPIVKQVGLEDSHTGHWPGCNLAKAISLLGGHVKMRGEASFLSRINRSVSEAMNTRLSKENIS